MPKASMRANKRSTSKDKSAGDDFVRLSRVDLEVILGRLRKSRKDLLLADLTLTLLVGKSGTRSGQRG